MTNIVVKQSQTSLLQVATILLNFLFQRTSRFFNLLVYLSLKF